MSSDDDVSDFADGFGLESIMRALLYLPHIVVTGIPVAWKVIGSQSKMY